MNAPRRAAQADDPREVPPGRAHGLGGPCEICRLWSRAPFCGTCIALYGQATARCPRCALPTAGGTTCGACAGAVSPVARTVVAFDYGFPWDRLVLELKFNARTELARPLAAALARALHGGGRDAELPRADAVVDCLVPIPLSPRRLAERGYNQSALLARELSAIVRLPVEARLLQRPLETAHQAGLTREQRLLNLRGAFMVDPRERAALAGRRVALVDDVVTTGATGLAAAGELLRAGAGAVELWAVARTA